MTSLRSIGFAAAFALSVGSAAVAVAAPDMATKMVGGAAMYPNRTIVDNAVNSKDHTTLVAAVTQAGLVDTLKGAGPFTVFAPTDAAFAKLPKSAVDGLMAPAGKAGLTKVLTYHVAPGRLTAADLMARVRAGGGKATITTVQGQPLTVTQQGSALHLMDAKGGHATVTIGDVIQSNGVIHVVDSVMMPN